MREVARSSEEVRYELFRDTATKMGGIIPAIPEKDFWVCWVLDYLFQDSPWKDKLNFKGGTSLSKAYSAIDRFSEDIDLILDWRLFGYSEDEPRQERSRTKQESFGEEANRRAASFLADEFAPKLQSDLPPRAESEIEVTAKGENVLIRYPRAFPNPAILPEIRLEMGPLADWVPNAERDISPYAVDYFPDEFNQPSTRVRTIRAERTFWEKATILHQEGHRSAEQRLPPRYSRHYYDLYRLSQLEVGKKALEQIDLLDDVVRFKMKFYPCTWAQYDQAKPGGLRLLPPEHNREELIADYEGMKSMLFGKVPPFDEIISVIAELENRINNVGAANP